MSIHIHISFFSFIKLLFRNNNNNNRNNNNNVKTLKTFKKVIFALLVLEKIKFEEM